MTGTLDSDTRSRRAPVTAALVLATFVAPAVVHAAPEAAPAPVEIRLDDTGEPCTLTLPPGDGPVPAAMLLTVAGPNDRDQTVFAHRVFRELAHGLAAGGVASLRCDDPGTGNAVGDYFASDYEDLAAEARRRREELAARPEIDP